MLDSPNAFNDLYCLVFQLFDLTWTQKNGTYMQFSAISDATKQRLHAVLDKHPTSLRQFAMLLQHECMSLYELWLLSSPSVPPGSVARGKRIVYAGASLAGTSAPPDAPPERQPAGPVLGK